GPRDADGLSLWYRLVNAGKRIVTLDLKTEAGRAALLALVARADVLLESFRPGALEKLGLGRAALAAANPRLIHCALSGYGQSGPLAGAAGHDINYMALGGGLAASGTEDRPVQAFPPTADHASALQAVIAILAALLRREREGRGAVLDVSLLESVLAWQALPITAALNRDPAVARGAGLLNGGAAFYRLYRTADGRFLSLGAIEPKFWENFCRALGRPDLAARQGEPLPQRDLIAEVEREVARFPLAHWEQVFAEVDTCAMPVVELAEVPEHPQIAARKLVSRGGGSHPWAAVGFPAWIDGAPPAPRAELAVATAEELLAAWR
ncbi:MAG: CaiB/BaiF CoA transferase family protein, partial [Kiloniellales bacterium]